MSAIHIYTKSWCGFCRRARALLEAKGLDYTEVDVSEDRSRELEMIRRSGRRTVPQIFVHGRSIGGYDDLVVLESSGELDRLLGPK